MMGLFESAFLPGFLYLLSCWYPNRGIGRYIGILVSCWPAASALVVLGSIVDPSTSVLGDAVPLTEIHSRYTNLLRIVGLIVTIGAVLCYPSLPSLPRTTAQFTEVERQVIVSHLAESSGWTIPSSYENEPNDAYSAFSGLWLAVLDPKTWFLAAICFFISFPVAPLDMPAAYLVLQPFFHKHGSDDIDALKKLNLTLFFILLAGMLIACAGGFLFDSIKYRNKWIRYAQTIGAFSGFVGVLAVGGVPSGGEVGDTSSKVLCVVQFISLGISWFCLPMALTWALSCFPWERNKRAACIAIITTVMSTGKLYAVLGPSLGFRAEDVPGDMTIYAVLVSCCVAAALTVVVLRRLLDSYNSMLVDLHNVVNDEFRELEHRYRFPI
ncbi:major facilitator superfamily domain-containing protein [Hypomontagnella submonticulosa]|nr:major facilitator superfamily domain-containing protein [Hypomontagnella submonticulosa]